MTLNTYSIEQSRFGTERSRAYTIRGLRNTDGPHKPCPTCYLDCAGTGTDLLVEYVCARGHAFTGPRGEGFQHATFLSRYHAGQDANR